MHAAVGTALGGVCTLVGEPQNLLIGEIAGWTFGEFFLRMAPVSLPVLVFFCARQFLPFLRVSGCAFFVPRLRRG